MPDVRWESGGLVSVPRLTTRVFSPTTSTAYLRLLGPVVAVQLHWTGSRSVPCTIGVCARCQEGDYPRWHGYAPALEYRRAQTPGAQEWFPVVLSVTQEMSSQLVELTAGAAELRGLVVEVRRERKGNGRVVLKLPKQPDAPVREPSFDVRPILQRLWGLRDGPPPGAVEGPTGPPSIFRADDDDDQGGANRAVGG